jgi:hypothetical protein
VTESDVFWSWEPELEEDFSHAEIIELIKSLIKRIERLEKNHLIKVF